MTRGVYRDAYTAVMTRSIPVPFSGCLIWEGAMSRNGYGNVWDRRRYRLPHIVAYEHIHGPVPSGMEIDHLCRVRLCCNVDHLEAVTCKVNLHRAPSNAFKINAAKTVCKHGHPLTTGNFRTEKSGKRTCLTCDRLRGRTRPKDEEAMRAYRKAYYATNKDTINQKQRQKYRDRNPP